MTEVARRTAELMLRGSQLYERGDIVDSQQAFSLALALQPDLAGARFNLAVTCRDLEQNVDAALLFQQLLSDQSFAADALNNLGILACRDEQWELGEQLFRQAIGARFQFPLAHFNLGTLLLRLGKSEEGWKEYHWRWQTPTFTPLTCPQPLWDGQPLDGTLLLHTEQGAGDTFQFVRYIPEIRRRCKRVLFVRPDALGCMFCDGEWADQFASAGNIALDTFDAVLPLMSAPMVLGPDIDESRFTKPYLTPEPRDIDLGPCHVPDAKLKVGFAWAGSPSHSNDAFRSTAIDQLAPLFEIPDIAFYSLQKGPQVADLKKVGSKYASVRDLDEMQNDFADTAAIMRQLDLVITVDTSVLHLAGGLGIPVWGLLSRRADWRWGVVGQTESPIYPSLRLFWQKTTSDWRDLVKRVAIDVTTFRDEKVSH